jgi:hypothetical protein
MHLCNDEAICPDENKDGMRVSDGESKSLS